MSGAWFNIVGDTSLPPCKFFLTDELTANSGGQLYFGIDTTNNGVTLTITTADIVNVDGRIIIVKDEGGNAGVNNITVATQGSEKIDTGVSATISTAFGKLVLMSRGGNLFIV